MISIVIITPKSRRTLELLYTQSRPASRLKIVLAKFRSIMTMDEKLPSSHATCRVARNIITDNLRIFALVCAKLGTLWSTRFTKDKNWQ